MEAVKKKRKVWPWVALAVVLALLLILAALVQRARLNADAVSYLSHTVARGSVTSTVTGSGRLQAADTKNVDVPSGIEVADVFVKAGDTVREGDTLALFDMESLVERAYALSGQLASLDAELARMSGTKTVEVIYAPVAGRLKALFAMEGSGVASAVAEYGALALISTDNLMQLVLETTGELTLSAEVEVRWEGGSETGIVAEKTPPGYLITLDDEVAPYGVSAEAYEGELLLGEGTLELHAPASVMGISGTVEKVNYEVGDKLTVSSKLFNIENGPFTNAYATKYTQRETAASDLAAVLAYLDDPRILAPEGGVVGTVSVLEGAAAGTASQASAASASAASNVTAFTLMTGGALKMNVAVDELDILSVLPGQGATVTLDAFPAKKFNAAVTRVSSAGETSKSVATFAVELTLEPDAQLMLGMNGNATILVDEAADALIIPVAAISEDASGAFVYVGDALTKTYITTGLSDGVNAVITSGLAEGDVVKYPDPDASSDPFSSFRSQFGNGPSDRS